jgi:hypothetical protein
MWSSTRGQPASDELSFFAETFSSRKRDFLLPDKIPNKASVSFPSSEKWTAVSASGETKETFEENIERPTST